MNNDFNIPLGFDNWLLNLMCFAFIVAACVHVWKMTRPEPSFEEQLKKFSDLAHHTFATKEYVNDSMDRVEEKIDERERRAIEFREELRIDIKELDKKLSERSGAIFDSLRSIGREVSNLDGRIARSGRLMSGEGGK